MSETPKDDNTPPAGMNAEPGAAWSEEEVARRRAMEFFQVLRSLTPRVVVTPALVAINLVVFVLMIASGVHLTSPTVPDMLKWGAEHGPNVLNGEWWRVFTCVFVHIGVVHLALNMFVLATAGPLVERLVGNAGFLVLYLVSGLGGSLVSLCYHPLAVSAGASGAIFGVYGALIVVLRQKPGAVPADVLLRIRNSGLAFVGYNLVFGFMASGIDNAAHVGGLAVGLLCGLILNQPLAPGSRAKRPARNALTALLGAVVVIGGMVAVNALHADLGDAGAEIERFVQMEERVLGAYNAAVAKAGRGELTDAAFADVLERDVLPDWRAAAKKLGALTNVPPDLGHPLAALLDYMRLRQESWELLVQALRTENADALQQARAKQEQAEQAIKKIPQAK